MPEEKGPTRRKKFDRQPKRKADEEFDRKWNEAVAAAAEVKYVQHKSLLGSEEGEEAAPSPATPRARCRSSGRPNRWWMLSVVILFLCMYWKYDSRKNIRININRTSIATREGEGELPSYDRVNLTSITQNIRPIKNTDIISTEVTGYLLKGERSNYNNFNSDWNGRNWTVLQKVCCDMLRACDDPCNYHPWRRRRRPPRQLRKRHPGLKRKKWREISMALFREPNLNHLFCGRHETMMSMADFINLAFSIPRAEVTFWVQYSIMLVQYYVAVSTFWLYYSLFLARKMLKVAMIYWWIFKLMVRRHSFRFAVETVLDFVAAQLLMTAKNIFISRPWKRFMNLIVRYPEVVVGSKMILTSSIAGSASAMYHVYKRLFTLLVLLMQSVHLVTAPHPAGSSVLNSSVPTAAVVVGMGIAAAGAAAAGMNSSMSSSSEGGDQNDSSPPKKKRRRCRSTLSIPLDAAAAKKKGSAARMAKQRAKRKADEEAAAAPTTPRPRCRSSLTLDEAAVSEAERKRKSRLIAKRKADEDEQFDRDWDEAAAAATEVKYVQHKSLLGGEEETEFDRDWDEAAAAATEVKYVQHKSLLGFEEGGEEEEAAPTTPRRRCRSSLTLDAAASGAERIKKFRAEQRRRADEESREQDPMEVEGNDDELKDITVGLDEAIKDCVKECQDLLGSTRVGKATYQARVCVMCDRVIKVSDTCKPISKEKLLEFKDKISVERYEQHYSRELQSELKKQYQVSDTELHGLLLSPRSRCGDDGKYDACMSCHRSLTTKKVQSPPKFSIANGFVIGSIPRVLRYVDKEGNQVEYTLAESCLTDLLCAAIAIVRPFGYVFSYTANAFNSIKGHITFFDMDQKFVGGVMNHFRNNIRRSNIYCVLCGRMKPSQKEAVRRRAQLKTEHFLHLINWFIKESGHPAYNNQTPPDECPQPQVVADPDNEHNTNEEDGADNDEECTFEGSSYYFSSNEDPQDGQSVFDSGKMFVKAMLSGNSPTMFVYGGKYTPRRELKLQDICPVQFPFGLGGPDENRDAKISQEECLKHYLQLSLRQFMKGDFILIVYHIYNRIISYETGVMKSKSVKDGKTLAERASKLTEKDVEEAGQRKAADKADLTKDADIMLKDVTASSKNIGHSAAAAKEALRNAFALSEFFGCHAIFATVTPDDLCTFRVKLTVRAGEEHTLPSLDHPGTTSTEDGGDRFDIDFQLRSQDRLNHPGACALEYKGIIELVIKVLFGWDSKSQTGKKGIVGELVAFGDSTEEQSRKSLHSHFTLWVKDFNKIRDSLFHESDETREKARMLMLKYVDKVMTASYGDDFHMMHSCNNNNNSAPSSPRRVSEVLRADVIPPPKEDEAAKERLETMRLARHKERCHEINGRILSCKNCDARFSPSEIINNALTTCQSCAQQDAAYQCDFEAVNFPLKQEHLDVAAYRFVSDFDLHSGECIALHDNPLFNDFQCRKKLMNLKWNEHSATHCQTCFKKNCECRFFFPQPTQMVTCLDDGADDEKWKSVTFHNLDGSQRDTRAYNIVPARHQGSEYLNTHNDALSSCLGCNTNIQIGDPSHTFYTTCYTYKDTNAEDSEQYMRVVNQITKHLARRKEQEMEQQREEMSRRTSAGAAAGGEEAARNGTEAEGETANDSTEAAAAETEAAAAETEAAKDDDDTASDANETEAAPREPNQTEAEERASFIQGLSLFLCAFYATTSRFICSSPLAHFIMMNGGSRFIFSHQFVEMSVVQMVDLLEGKGTSFRLRKTKSKTGNVKYYPDCFAHNYIHRPTELEEVCFYDQMMRYNGRFYTFKEIDGNKSESENIVQEEEMEVDGDDGDDGSGEQPNPPGTNSKVRDGRLRFSKTHPGYEFAYLEERKNIVIPRVSLPDGELCRIKDLKLDEEDGAVATDVLYERREAYAKLALIMFCPFRELSDLKLNGRYWDRFMLELNRINNPEEHESLSVEVDGARFWPKGIEILHNIDNRKAMEKLPRPDDMLKRATIGTGEEEEKQKESDPFVANLGEFDDDFDRDPFNDIFRSDDDPLSFGGIIDRANIQSSHLTEVAMTPGESSVFLSDDDDATTTVNEQGGKASRKAGRKGDEGGKRSSFNSNIKYATVLEFLRGSVVGNDCYYDDDDDDDDDDNDGSERGRDAGLPRLPSLRGVADKVAKKEGKELDEKQYIAYEILCCSFILELVESGELKEEFEVDSRDERKARNNKARLIRNLEARLAKRNLTMFLTGPAGSGKSTAVDVAQRYCYELSLALNIIWDNSFLFTSTTGSSAALFGGITIHTAAGLMTKMENIGDEHIARFKHVRLLIVDEISYFSKKDVRNLDMRLKKIRGRSDLPFGGLPIVFCGDFHQLLPVNCKPDHVLYSNAKGDNYWEQIISTIVVLENKHRFKDDPDFGNLLTRLWRGKVTNADMEKINSRVIGHNGLELPSLIDGDVAYACPLNDERNSVNRGLFANHVRSTCPKVTSEEEPPEHTVLIEAFIHSDSENKNRLQKGQIATTRVPKFFIDCILTQCGDSDIRTGKNGDGIKIDPALPCYPGAKMMATDNRKLKTLGVGNGTTCTVVGIKLKDGARKKWKNWDGRKVNTVLATEVDHVLFQHSPAETPKIKSLQSKIDGLEEKNTLSEAEETQLANVRALLEKEKQARYFKLKPVSYIGHLGVSMIPEVMRSDKTKGTFKFVQLPVNTNDATTGHKLQGMSKDHLIITSWDGISKWPNWAYTVLSRVRKLEGLFLCKPLTSSVSFKLPEELQVYERFMIRKEQQMLDDRESMLKELEDRNDHLNL